MKGRNGPTWAHLAIVLTIFLLGSGDRVFSQTMPKSDLPIAADPAAVQPFHNLTLVRTGNGQGKVLANPAGSSFKKGTTVTLTAVPAPHSVFDGWSGSCGGLSRTCSVILSADRIVDASFSLKTYSIQVRPPKNGVVHPYGTVKAGHGEKRRFQIIPLPGYKISEVRVDNVSQGALNTYTFKEITADHVLEAIFVKQ